jgi:hypothetical protein
MNILDNKLQKISSKNAFIWNDEKWFKKIQNAFVK